MESLSRVNLYRNMIRSERYRGEHLTAIKTNIMILEDVESQFLSEDTNPEFKEVKDPFVRDLIRRNIGRVREDEDLSKNSRVIHLLKKLDNVVLAYSNKREDVSKNSRNLFNRVLNELTLFNKKFFRDRVVPRGEAVNDGKTQVFLSHAFDDKLYSTALFDHFYDLGIYLYVDWMHNGMQKDGRVLKDYLNNELDNSEQLLFLRTANTELDIQGKHMLRSWCAWELGNFFRKNRDEKYVINLYSVESYYNDTNLQVHGLKMYTEVIGNRLHGVEIAP